MKFNTILFAARLTFHWIVFFSYLDMHSKIFAFFFFSFFKQLIHNIHVSCHRATNADMNLSLFFFRFLFAPLANERYNLSHNFTPMLIMFEFYVHLPYSPFDSNCELDFFFLLLFSTFNAFSKYLVWLLFHRMD